MRGHGDRHRVGSVYKKKTMATIKRRDAERVTCSARYDAFLLALAQQVSFRDDTLVLNPRPWITKPSVGIPP